MAVRLIKGGLQSVSPSQVAKTILKPKRRAGGGGGGGSRKAQDQVDAQRRKAAELASIKASKEKERQLAQQRAQEIINQRAVEKESQRINRLRQKLKRQKSQEISRTLRQTRSGDQIRTTLLRNPRTKEKILTSENLTTGEIKTRTFERSGKSRKVRQTGGIKEKKLKTKDKKDKVVKTGTFKKAFKRPSNLGDKLKTLQTKAERGKLTNKDKAFLVALGFGSVIVETGIAIKQSPRIIKEIFRDPSILKNVPKSIKKSSVEFGQLLRVNPSLALGRIAGEVFVIATGTKVFKIVGKLSKKGVKKISNFDPKIMRIKEGSIQDPKKQRIKGSKIKITSIEDLKKTKERILRSKRAKDSKLSKKELNIIAETQARKVNSLASKITGEIIKRKAKGKIDLKPLSFNEELRLHRFVKEKILQSLSRRRNFEVILNVNFARKVSRKESFINALKKRFGIKKPTSIKKEIKKEKRMILAEKQIDIDKGKVFEDKLKSLSRRITGEIVKRRAKGKIDVTPLSLFEVTQLNKKVLESLRKIKPGKKKFDVNLEFKKVKRKISRPKFINDLIKKFRRKKPTPSKKVIKQEKKVSDIKLKSLSRRITGEVVKRRAKGKIDVTPPSLFEVTQLNKKVLESLRKIKPGDKKFKKEFKVNNKKFEIILEDPKAVFKRPKAKQFKKFDVIIKKPKPKLLLPKDFSREVQLGRTIQIKKLKNLSRIPLKPITIKILKSKTQKVKVKIKQQKQLQLQLKKQKVRQKSLKLKVNKLKKLKSNKSRAKLGSALLLLNKSKSSTAQLSSNLNKSKFALINLQNSLTKKLNDTLKKSATKTTTLKLKKQLKKKALKKVKIFKKKKLFLKKGVKTKKRRVGKVSKRERGHDVFIKPIKTLSGKKAKNFVKANKSPLKKKRAKDLRNLVIDRSLGRTGEIRATSKKPKKSRLRIPRGFAKRSKSKFRKVRKSKGKRIPLKRGRVIERSRNLLDTKQEKKKIGVRRFLKQLDKSSKRKKSRSSKSGKVRIRIKRRSKR